MTAEHDLAALGLGSKEVRVYLDLAEVGKSTAQHLSKRTKVPRATVYWALENLVARGLVSEERKRSTTFFKANQPAALTRMIQLEKEQAEYEYSHKETIAQELVKNLGPIFKSKGFSVPRLQFFEGKEGVTALLYDQTPTWRESIAKYDFTWWGYQDHTFAEHYQSWLEDTWKLKVPEEQYRVVTNRSNVEEKLKAMAPHRRMKFVNPQWEFSSTIWSVGDYIVLIMTSQKPHYAFQLHDAVFAANLRTMLQIMWASDQWEGEMD